MSDLRGSAAGACGTCARDWGRVRWRQLRLDSRWVDGHGRGACRSSSLVLLCRGRLGL